MRKILDVCIFIISVFCFGISLKLLWEMGIFADEYNMTPSLVCGGEIGLLIYWLRLLCLLILCVLSGIKLIKK